MDEVEDKAVRAERGVDAEAVATTERLTDYLLLPERGPYAPSCMTAGREEAESPEYVMYEGADEELLSTATVYGGAESSEIVMYEDEDAEMRTTAATATEFEQTESPEYVMYEGEAAEPPDKAEAADKGHAELPEHVMFEYSTLKSLEFFLNEGLEADFQTPCRENDESPEVAMYNGAGVDFPATATEEENAQSPEFVMHDGDDTTPESMPDKMCFASPARASNALIEVRSSPSAVVAATDEASDSTPARGRYVKVDSMASAARGYKSKAEEAANLSIEETEDGTPARVARSFTNASKIVPVAEALVEEATAETSERGAYEEVVPAKKKGDKHSQMPERGSFSIPEEGASHEEYMEAWLRMDATAAGEELMRLLEEEAPPEATERSVISDGSHALPSICRPSSSSFITMNSNEESGCSSFSDWNTTAIVTVDMTGVAPLLVAEPHNVVGDGMDGVDCEWSDSAFECLYEEDEEGERGDGEVLLPDSGQEETSPKA